MGMKLVMIMGAVMIAMTLAFSWYYKDTQKRMGVLYENNAKLEVSVRASEAYGDNLRSVLQKHNLTMLSRKKPGLIEKRMNDATQKLFDDITADTTH